MTATQIHPAAIVHPAAVLGPGCTVGPGAVIDGEVELGPDCVVGPQVVLTGRLIAGARNRFHAGAVIGDAPQDLKYRNQPTRLRLGDDNVIREHATIHRSTALTEDTVVGNGNFIMANAHVGHNCRIGNHNVIANGALLAGHVTVEDRAFISGNCVIHQYCRIGRLAMLQGGSALGLDLPPFCILREVNMLCGLNTVGLRRAGIPSAERLELRRAYHAIFRSGKRRATALAEARGEFSDSLLVQELLLFMEGTKRGICADPGRRTAMTDPSLTE
jgi:UDP-N-acetylglucosamine acyltransferase